MSRRDPIDKILQEVLLATMPDSVVVGGDVLARLEVRDLNNGRPTFRMFTYCSSCDARLTRDTIDVRDYEVRQRGLLRRQERTAQRHYQTHHAAPA